METILIIDDTSELRENIAEILRLEGYQVLQAEDGMEGIRLANLQQPDLILCDILMPGLDGMDVMRLLKEAPDSMHFPFIFISALEDRKHIREGMELGADDYLTKPFTMDELLRSVRTRLQKKKSLENLSRSYIDNIEKELKHSIDHLEERINEQQHRFEDVFQEKEQAVNLLKNQQAQLMQDALRTIEINNTMQYISDQLTVELLKPDLQTDQRKTLGEMRNKLRNRSILLNNQTVFQLKFNQTYPNFRKYFNAKYPNLRKQDLVLLSAIYMQLNTSQISVILNISAESVLKKKYRLKQKLGLPISLNVSEFVQQLQF